MTYEYTNKKIFFNKYIFTFALFAIPASVFANISITEIMYDVSGYDTGREWVEISADASTDISNWKFFEANINHGLTLVKGSATIAAGSAAVVADNTEKFLIDYPSFSGTLFDSSFSLNNTGETIAIRDQDGIDVDSILYNPALGAAGDGNSLQKINGVWTAAAPTPGVSPASDPSGTSGSGSGSEESSSAATTEQSPGSSGATQSIWADAGLDRMAIVGGGTIFEGKALGIDKKPLDGARYFWNFGDGFTGEGKKVMHTYKHPGDYIVYLDVSSGSLSAGDKILVKATPADVSISALGYGEKSFVAVSNGEAVELDVSYWQIKSSGGIFVIPKNTIIIPGNKIIFSKDALGFEIKDGDKVLLIYPNGSLAYEFPNVVTVFVANSNQAANAANTGKPAYTENSYNNETEDVLTGGNEAKSGSDLTASVANSLPDNTDSNGMSKWLMGLAAIIIFSGAGALWIKNSGQNAEENPKIKILE